MRKKLAMIVMAVITLPLAACGGGKSPNTDPGETSPTQSSETEKTPVSQEASEEIKVAKDGEFVLSSADIAVVVNGKKVLMPYNLVELENAGVPVNEMFREDELASGDSFSLNLYLDENDDYLLIPGYYNGGDDTVVLTEAEAKTITMVSYADEPADQGVSLLGVTFGMSKSDVKAMLGEPMSDSGDYCEWQIVVTDADYIGNFSIYFTGDSDDAGACEIRLDFMEW